MPDPQFQHTAEELRHVADILDVLNAGCTAQSVGAAGGILDIYWCESKMGVIDRDYETWVYFPSARPVPQRTGDIAWESQEPDAIVRVEVVTSIGYEEIILTRIHDALESGEWDELILRLKDGSDVRCDFEPRDDD